MSEAGGMIRIPDKTAAAIQEAEEMTKQLQEKTGASSVKELAEAFLINDHCLTHMIYLDAISTYLENGGRSRGSCLVADNRRDYIEEIVTGNLKPLLCNYERDIENNILEVALKDGMINKKLVKTREIPVQDLWFEKIWRDFSRDNMGGY
jgi:hypothetical protein